ncbi:MAG: SpoIIE family protein phosphatase [Solirubrobacteraceae bacterium]
MSREDQGVGSSEPRSGSWELPAPREVFDIAHDGFLSLDAEGRILHANPRAEELFGYEGGQARGIDLVTLVAEDERELVREALQSLTVDGSERQVKWHLSVRALRSDAAELPVEISATGISSLAGWTIHAWIRDVSERVQLLRELEDQLRGDAPGMTQILDALAEAVTIRDPHNHIIYANRVAVAQMGFSSLEELQTRPPQAIFDDYIVQDEHGRDLAMGDIPSVRLLSGEAGAPLLLRTVHRVTGEIKWNLLKSTLIHDDAGEPVAAVTVIEDVTREKTTELRQRFLSRATDNLMSSLDYQETLRNVAWLAVPEIADWCAVDLIDEGGQREQVVVAHTDPAKLVLAEQLRAYDPRQANTETGVGRVVASGISELYPDVTDDMLVTGAVDQEHLRLLRTVGLRSVLLVPLRARGRSLGVMTLVMAESLRRFDDRDLEFAEQLAGRAAMAVDNARLATARREIAETLQRSLLPDAVPAIPGWSVATMYRPASVSDEVEVGGDFYDFFETPEGWIVLLGDVTGRGVEAAAMTSLVRHGARFLAKQEHRPSRILHRLNDALREQPGLSLCSALCARLEEGCAVMSSAGHPPPLIIRDDGRIREIGSPGPLLGGWETSSWRDRTVPVGPEETLLMYTDGVTDTRGEHDRFGARRLRRVLKTLAGTGPGALLSELQAALDDFQVEGHSDDTGAVALRPAGAEVVSGAASDSEAAEPVS